MMYWSSWVKSLDIFFTIPFEGIPLRAKLSRDENDRTSAMYTKYMSIVKALLTKNKQA